VLDAVAAAGYAGIDLGPVGYLGTGPQLADELGGRSLRLTGGYLEVDIGSDAAVTAGIKDLAEILTVFDAVSDGVPARFMPRPTIALITPSLTGTERDDSEALLWERARAALRSAEEVSRDRGYEPCLHNEHGTFIARPADIDRALSASTISLCLDIGHLLLAGGDPVECAGRWWQRIDHLHVKDVRQSGVDLMRQPGADPETMWSESVFCALGQGAGRISEFAELVTSRDYAGWIVVEQDILPSGASSYATAAADQVTNREFLASLGF
jgi:inosose dehydratase